MSKEYARVESAVNLILGKPVAAVVYALLIWGQWTGRHVSRLAARLRHRYSARQGNAPRN